MNFTVPEDWHIITDYALKGGPKPSYERAQKIWDAYLECTRFENCTPNMQYHAPILRQGSFSIPAIGYNDLPLDSRFGKSTLPCSTAYRLSDRMEIVYEKGFHPPVTLPGTRGGSHLRDHMHLRMREGEYVSYSVRTADIYGVWATYCADAPALVRVSTEKNVLFEDFLPAAAEIPVNEPSVLFPNEPAANHLTEIFLGETAGEQLIRFEVLRGEVDFGKILIREK